MKPKLTALALLAFLPISPATAADLAEGARSMLGNAVAAMRSISAGGGYLWRYSDDLTKARWGEKSDRHGDLDAAARHAIGGPSFPPRTRGERITRPCFK